MKKLIRLIVAALSLLYSNTIYGQQITSAEYFYDIDPGVGFGIPIGISSSDSVDISAIIPVTGLTTGNHNLFVRTRNINGTWSFYTGQAFYVHPTVEQTKIITAEYFFDSDPGEGNGTTLSTGALADSIDISYNNINSTGLSSGFHNLFIRTRNNLGKWSLYAGETFNINPSLGIPGAKIAKAEYFFDTDPGVGNGILVSPSFLAADSLDTTRGISSIGLTTGPHRLMVRVQNVLGKWSMAVSDSFHICNLPVISILTGSVNVCPGAMITLADSVTGGIWSSSNMTATVSSGVVTGVTAGIDTIRYAVSNTCGTAIVTKTITVSALPSAGTISGSIAVCVSAVITLTDPVAGGIWSCINANATVSAGAVTGISPGTDTVKYAVTNTCGTAIASKSITINPLPSAGTITGPSAVCPGASITLSDAITGGTWSSSSTIATVAGGIVTGVSTGTDTIKYSVTNTCGTAIVSHGITINSPIPAAGIITGASNVCAGSATTLTDTTSGGLWSSSDSLATVSGGIVTGVSSGIDTIKYSVTNTCGTGIATRVISINPLPIVGIIAGDTVVCLGSLVLLSDTITGGEWTASNTLATVSGGLVTGISLGISVISYSVINPCGTATVIKNITISTIPSAGSIIGPDSVCAGYITRLVDTAYGGIWSSVNAFATIDSSGAVTGISEGADAIIYAVTNNCGTAEAIFPISVLPGETCTPAKVQVISLSSTTVKVYPNPNEGIFTLLISTANAEQVIVSISNILGENVNEMTVTSNKDTLVQIKAAPGVYFLGCTTSGVRYIEKVVINK